jgi:hypothetical protein
MGCPIERGALLKRMNDRIEGSIDFVVSKA